MTLTCDVYKQSGMAQRGLEGRHAVCDSIPIGRSTWEK